LPVECILASGQIETRGAPLTGCRIIACSECQPCSPCPTPEPGTPGTEEI
jgi:hypothetical protein